jgi:hypothetical protein
MQRTENESLPAGKQFMSVIESSKKTDTRLTTTVTRGEIEQKHESQMTRVEVLRSPEDILSQGVLDSMSIIDSSASVLHSQMSSLLKTENPEIKRPGEWATQLAIQCGTGIAHLIKAKTDAMRLLKK